MALTDVQKLRLELGDTELSLPILTDDEYLYFLEKNNNSIKRASLDAAKTILFKMSMRDDSIVDIFTISSAKTANAYRETLKLYIKNPELNGLFSSINGHFNGISLTDINSQISNPDNNNIELPSQEQEGYENSYNSLTI